MSGFVSVAFDKSVRTLLIRPLRIRHYGAMSPGGDQTGVRSFIVALASFAMAAAPAFAADAFYQAQPAELHGHPGTLIRAEPMRATGARRERRTRILYRSDRAQG